MKVDVKVRHVTPADANIFLELGFDAAEAASLKAESDRLIAEELAIKQKLREEVTGWMRANHLRQQEAARILQVTRPRVSDVVNGKLSKFSIDSLIGMVLRTGKSVEISTR